MFHCAARGKKGEIYIYEDIGEGWFGGLSAKRFSDELKKLGKVDELSIYLNSPGGNVFDGVAIYNQIRRFEAVKTVYIDGLAASIASIIALSGDKVEMAENAMFMMHDPWGFAVGTADEMRKSADSLEKVKETLVTTYVSKTGHSPSVIEEWMTEETWMTAQEALDNKFIDRIGEEKVVENSVGSILLAKYRNTPKNLLKGALDARTRLAHMQMTTAKIRNARAAKQ